MGAEALNNEAKKLYRTDAKPEEAPPTPEIKSPESSEVPAIEPRSELEKRLGMPLNAPITSPVKTAPIETKPAKPSNQFRPVEPSAPLEAPIKLPQTLEAPSEEPTPIPSIQ